MDNPIRAAIASKIASGADVTTAYRQASYEFADALESRLREATSLEQAIGAIGIGGEHKLAARLRRLDAIDRPGLFVIVSGGHVDDVPEASCVAEKLRDKPKPTREDIEEAFKACSKTA